MIWGLDIGVRSFHAAGIDDEDELTLVDVVLPTPRKVADQSATDRARELGTLCSKLRDLVRIGDLVVMEEPPLSGTKNARTFLRLAQVSGALAVAVSSGGVSCDFIPVDSWKLAVCGKGGLSKCDVARLLAEMYPYYAARCAGNQNRIDAVCIALAGVKDRRAS